MAISLGIKAHVAGWIRRRNPQAQIKFEETIETTNDDGTEEDGSRCRVDVIAEGVGRFEVESLCGSGPIEVFLQNKVYSRVGGDGDPFWLVVPSESILWLGPFLADAAHRLMGNGLRKQGGNVLLAGPCGAHLTLAGTPLVPPVDSEVPWDKLTHRQNLPRTELNESIIRLTDVIRTNAVAEAVDELVIWPEKNGRRYSRQSRSSGILFFGPPGCGKSRLAKAIAGELDRVVRILSPSDLRGPYIGWGQIMIREQFDWLAESGNRMLIIDELDAVARSRREEQMHSDEKAEVNELLVQLDRVFGLRRVVVATTNFISALDEAVLRSGRFGRFIPVPPPDIEEATKIARYFFDQISVGGIESHSIRVETPDYGVLRDMLTKKMQECQKSRKFLCGADLEEAVNRAYTSAARQAGEEAVEVNITAECLEYGLQVKASIEADSIDRFLQEVERFCTESVFTQLKLRFSESG